MPFIHQVFAREQVALREGRMHALDHMIIWSSGGRRLNMHDQMRGLWLTGLGEADLIPDPLHLPLRKPHHDLLSPSASLRRLAFLKRKNLQYPEKQGLHSRKNSKNPVSLMMHRR